MRERLRPGAIVILDDTDRPEEASDRILWQDSGLELAEDGESFCLLRLPTTSVGAARPRVPSRNRIADAAYVISLPDRSDRLDALRGNRAAAGLEFELIPGVRPSEREIGWWEMRGMEAYGNVRGGGQAAFG